MTQHPILRTLTHARLREAQGDVAGARRLAEEIARDEGPDAEAARRFLAAMEGARAPAARAAEPAIAHRIRRLERWLARLRQAQP